MISIKKKPGLIVLCVIILLTIGILKISQENSVKESLLSPEEVIEKFFKYHNEKDLEGMKTLTTEGYFSPNSKLEFDNLEYIKIIDIDEYDNINEKEIYVRMRKRGQIIDLEKEKEELENLCIYKVKLDVKYIKEGVGPSDSGMDIQYYFLKREDKNSPWLIESAGH